MSHGAARPDARPASCSHPVPRLDRGLLGVACPIAAGLGAQGARAESATGPLPVCTMAPTPADRRAAKGAHEAAARFYDRKDFERAIKSWLSAYQLDCQAHGVLVNIAAAQEKLGDLPGAITTLSTYIARGGKKPVAGEKLAELRERFARGAELP